MNRGGQKLRHPDSKNGDDVTVFCRKGEGRIQPTHWNEVKGKMKMK